MGEVDFWEALRLSRQLASCLYYICIYYFQRWAAYSAYLGGSDHILQPVFGM